MLNLAHMNTRLYYITPQKNSQPEVSIRLITVQVRKCVYAIATMINNTYLNALLKLQLTLCDKQHKQAYTDQP